MRIARYSTTVSNSRLLHAVVFLFLASAHIAHAAPLNGTTPQSNPTPESSQKATGDSADAAVTAFLHQVTASLAGKPDSDLDYFWKRVIDLGTSPSLWMFVIVAAVLLIFREQISALIESLQSVKIGSVELVRAIREITSELHDLNPDLQVPLDADRLGSLAALQSYPAFRVLRTLESPFIQMNWQSAAARLRALEMQLVLQEERLLNSPDFDKEKPPRNFVSAKSQLFTLFVCFGNLYGFVKSQTPTDRRPIDLEASMYFLQKAIDLKPQTGAQTDNTLGYANFCMGAVAGLLALELLGANAPALQLEARALIIDALKRLSEAEANGHKPAYQNHLKAYLLFELGRFGEAAEAWKSAAMVWLPPSSKMYFNCACALSKLGKYQECLNQLEEAVKIWRSETAAGPSDFDPRTEAENQQSGEEFSPFWGLPPVPAAVNARSDTGKSFADITA